MHAAQTRRGHAQDVGTSARPLDAIIVDDEELARQKIRDLLRDETRVAVRAECRNGREAVAAILELEPDLVFLDVQMPDLDGFGVIDQVGRERMPAVIFTTAHDEFAVRAFDAAAADYLLKPYDRQRFQRALERALELFRHHRVEELGAHVKKLMSLGLDGRRNRFEPERPDRLVIKTGSTVHLVKMDDVDWIEAARNYVRVHSSGDCHTMRETMANIEAKLDPERFLRIHRSTIVNVDRIRKIEPGYGSESRVELEDGTKLMISRAYRRGRVKEMLEELQ